MRGEGTRSAWSLVTLLLAGLLAAPPTTAHKPSDSYLTLTLGTGQATGRWDIALRDLDYALGLDTDLDGDITWGEVRTRHRDIAAYALARLDIRAATGACATSVSEQALTRHSDGVYAALRFDWGCPGKSNPATLEYSLFFDLDASHRGLLQVDNAGEARSAVLSPAQPSILLDRSSGTGWYQFTSYWREGVWHIWHGLDHLLFILTLLLPAVLYHHRGRWRASDDPRQITLDVVKVVTAFTVAHSLTLALAMFGWISLPSALVETAIAATVVLAAVNNLFPVFHHYRARIAFALGLVHGLGFANVLTDLGLPGDTLAIALAAFNLGVEAGQLAVVLIVLPLAYALRAGRFYRRVVLELGSLAIAALASVWLVERSTGLRVWDL